MRRLVPVLCGGVLAAVLSGCASQTITEALLRTYGIDRAQARRRLDRRGGEVRGDKDGRSGLERLEKHQSHQRRQVTGAMR